jgi:hypothetical protein
MPYVAETGNAWVCWNCISAQCSRCINKRVRTTAEDMQPCDCPHPSDPGWVLIAAQQQPIPASMHETGPFSVIREPRPYAADRFPPGIHHHRRAS